MKREELIRYLDKLLEAGRFRDYCPNGLQVEGRSEVQRLVAGVSATQALLDAAVARDADAILVHHGWFWRGEDGRVTGMRKTRLQKLLRHDLNLIAYHLPLDGHPELGNNAQLAKQFGWLVDDRFGDQDIGWVGRLPQPVTLGALTLSLAARLGREPLMLGEPERIVERIGWCTGGAQGYFEQAIACGVDCFVSGEASEPTTHQARESGVAYLCVGHHASERYGVQALGAHLAEAFGIEVEFVEVPNPV